MNLRCHLCLNISGFEGAHVGVDEVAGAVAVERGFVLAADDGEGAQDVAGILPRDTVEVEVEGVQAGAQVAALYFIPMDVLRAPGTPNCSRQEPSSDCRRRMFFGSRGMRSPSSDHTR